MYRYFSIDSASVQYGGTTIPPTQSKHDSEVRAKHSVPKSSLSMVFFCVLLFYGGPFGSKRREYKLTHVNTRLEDTLRQRAQATHARTRSGNTLKRRAQKPCSGNALRRRAQATHAQNTHSGNTDSEYIDLCTGDF